VNDLDLNLFSYAKDQWMNFKRVNFIRICLSEDCHFIYTFTRWLLSLILIYCKYKNILKELHQTSVLNKCLLK
jgi:hypothetical protein